MSLPNEFVNSSSESIPGRKSAQFEAHFHSGLATIEKTAWNRLAGDGNPFLKYQFLQALELSGSTTKASGWQPHHLSLHRPGKSEPLAVMPLYIKSHSWGEYVFDWTWANAYHSHGLSYYPKLLSAVPFTPSAGPRLLARSEGSARLAGSDVSALNAFAVAAVTDEARRLEASSWHVLFPSPEQSEAFERAGLRQRSGCQFQWFNRKPGTDRPYESFEDFLESFSSRKRKNLRKERKSVADQGIRFVRIEGRDITAELWDHFYLFYQSTYLVRGQQGYLSRDFFTRVGAEMPDNILLVMAEHEGRYIAGALSFKGGGRLYGRYWGSLDEYEFLHFETCYYQGIDYCITHGLAAFDSGAQGEHKIQRGFEPVQTFSNHWIADSRFDTAIAGFLDEEGRHMANYRAEAATLLPFRQTSS